MDYETIILEREEGIATITLNRPEKVNAATLQMITELIEAIGELSRDDNVKVVILTGAGRVFCPGADHTHPVFKSENPAEVRQWVHQFGEVSFGLRSLPQPVIASVNGAAVGAGCSFALACDIIIASENARFSQGFVNIGLIPDSGGCYFLPRLIGVAKACELVFTGDMIDAREAERMGLVNKVVPADLLATTTRELALRLAKGPTAALRSAKTCIYQGLEMDLASVIERETDAQTVCILSEDCKEGLRAFAEKRPPVFRGR